LGGRGIASIQHRGRRIRPAACGAASIRAVISGWENWCCSWLPKQAASYGTNRINQPNFRGSNSSGWRGGFGSGAGWPGSASPGGGASSGEGAAPSGGSRRGRTVRGRGGRSLPASARAAREVNRARRWRSRPTARTMSGPEVRSAAIRLATAWHSPPMMRPKVRLRPGGAGWVSTTPYMTIFLHFVKTIRREIRGKKANSGRSTPALALPLPRALDCFLARGRTGFEARPQRRSAWRQGGRADAWMALRGRFPPVEGDRSRGVPAPQRLNRTIRGVARCTSPPSPPPLLSGAC
jgi:hypothetical protein